MAGNLIPTVAYLVTQAKASLGHARVYPRTRSTRSRQKFETLFVGPGGLDWWTVRRVLSTEVHRGASHQATRTHRIVLTGTRAAQDQDDAVDSPEVLLQQEIEDLAELVRHDPSLGWNVEHATATEGALTEVKVAGVTCHRAEVVVEAREALHW